MREYRSTLLGNPDEDRKDGLIIIKPVLDGRLKNVNTAPKPDVKKETTDTSLLEQMLYHYEKAERENEQMVKRFKNALIKKLTETRSEMRSYKLPSVEKLVIK